MECDTPLAAPLFSERRVERGISGELVPEPTSQGGPGGPDRGDRRWNSNWTCSGQMGAMAASATWQLRCTH